MQPQTDGAIVEVAAGQCQPGQDFDYRTGAPEALSAGFCIGVGVVGEEGQALVFQRSLRL